MVDTMCYYGCNKGGSMADKNVKVPKKRDNKQVRCLFKEELDRYHEITKRDRSAIMLLAWEHFKTTDFYKRDMFGLKVK
jgi:hypothetical protein